MGNTAAGVLTVGTLAAALVAVHRPFGDYLYRVVAGTAHSRAERAVYRLVGVDADREQSWGVYARSVLAFSAVGVLLLYALLRLQDHLWLSRGLPAVTDHVAWNTAVSFVTNTNWQAYPGETTMSHLAQMSGLAVQNFVSAAVGIAVAVALVRGFARARTDRLGNFWVDLTRVTLPVLVPISLVAAVVLVLGGVAQNLADGPVAGQEAIKELGTNGGGFFNANSAAAAAPAT